MSEGAEEHAEGDEGEEHEARDAAGHAEHFLQRLDRLDDERVELALTMYRDHESVKLLLDLVAPSRGAGRVAFALGAEEKPPYVIVTSEGRFVTCLAPGMGADGCAVVPYGAFIAGVGRVETLRSRAREWDAREHGPGFGVIARLVNSGPWVPREDIAAILAVQPFLQARMWNMWVRTPGELYLLAEGLERHTKPAHRATVSEKSLRTVWYMAHSLGHLALVATYGSMRDFSANLDTEVMKKRTFFAPFRMALRQRLPFVSLQVLNAVARIGRLLVPTLKRQLANATSGHSVVEACLQLAAIGARQDSLAGEVRKVLLSDGDPGSPGHEHRRDVREAREEIVALALDGDRSARDVLLIPGHRELVRTYDDFQARGLMKNPRPYRALEDHEPRDLCALAMAELVAPSTNVEAVMQLAAAIPWAARIDPEDFYLPEREQRIERRPWGPDNAWSVIEGVSSLIPRRAPTRVEKTPGRNDPCSCGSGKKFKKCCGG